MKKLISIFLILPAIFLMSCSKEDDPELNNFKVSTGLSIFVNNGKVGITTLVNKNYKIYTEYWIDSTKSDTEGLKTLMPSGNYFRTSIDNYYLVTTVYKKNDGTIVEYKFPRSYSLDPANQLIYFKNGERYSMDTVMLGAIHSVSAADSEVFAGFFADKKYSENGAYFSPVKAFYWDGINKPVELPMPNNYFYFNGVSCIYKSGNDVYVGGSMDFPMYWKNKDMVRLSDKYGEVNQIIVIGTDVYAVGYYNKMNSTSTGHTACYWKNGVITELEDDAIAYSIYKDGNDIYVAGAKGRFDAEYKACYWKNGKRVMLPDE